MIIVATHTHKSTHVVIFPLVWCLMALVVFLGGDVLSRLVLVVMFCVFVLCGLRSGCVFVA